PAGPTAGPRRRRRAPAGGSHAPLAQQQRGDLEVVRRGDLEVLRRRLDDPYGAAGLLDEPGVVGGARERGGVAVERALEDVAAERLRRLDRPQARAVERGGHEQVVA